MASLGELFYEVGVRVGKQPELDKLEEQLTRLAHMEIKPGTNFTELERVVETLSNIRRELSEDRAAITTWRKEIEKVTNASLGEGALQSIRELNAAFSDLKNADLKMGAKASLSEISEMGVKTAEELQKIKGLVQNMHLGAIGDTIAETIQKRIGESSNAVFQVEQLISSLNNGTRAFVTLPEDGRAAIETIHKISASIQSLRDMVNGRELRDATAITLPVIPVIMADKIDTSALSEALSRQEIRLEKLQLTEESANVFVNALADKLRNHTFELENVEIKGIKSSIEALSVAAKEIEDSLQRSVSQIMQGGADVFQKLSRANLADKDFVSSQVEFSELSNALADAIRNKVYSIDKLDENSQLPVRLKEQIASMTFALNNVEVGSGVRSAVENALSSVQIGTGIGRSAESSRDSSIVERIDELNAVYARLKSLIENDKWNFSTKGINLDDLKAIEQSLLSIHSLASTYKNLDLFDGLMPKYQNPVYFAEEHIRHIIDNFDTFGLRIKSALDEATGIVSNKGDLVSSILGIDYKNANGGINELIKIVEALTLAKEKLASVSKMSQSGLDEELRFIGNRKSFGSLSIDVSDLLKVFAKLDAAGQKTGERFDEIYQKLALVRRAIENNSGLIYDSIGRKTGANIMPYVKEAKEFLLSIKESLPIAQEQEKSKSPFDSIFGRVIDSLNSLKASLDEIKISKIFDPTSLNPFLEKLGTISQNLTEIRGHVQDIGLSSLAKAYEANPLQGMVESARSLTEIVKGISDVIKQIELSGNNKTAVFDAAALKPFEDELVKIRELIEGVGTSFGIGMSVPSEKGPIQSIISSINELKESISGIDFSKAFNPEQVETFSRILMVMVEKLGQVRDAIAGIDFSKLSHVGVSGSEEFMSPVARNIANGIAAETDRIESAVQKITDVKGQISSLTTSIQEDKNALEFATSQIENELAKFSQFFESITIDQKLATEIENVVAKLESLGEQDGTRGIMQYLEKFVEQADSYYAMLEDVYNKYSDLSAHENSPAFGIIDSLVTRINESYQALEQVRDTVQEYIDNIQGAGTTAEKHEYYEDLKGELSQIAEDYGNAANEALKLSQVDTEHLETIASLVQGEQELRDNIASNTSELEKQQGILRENRDIKSNAEIKSANLQNELDIEKTRRNVFTDMLDALQQIQNLVGNIGLAFRSVHGDGASIAEEVRAIREKTSALMQNKQVMDSVIASQERMRNLESELASFQYRRPSAFEINRGASSLGIVDSFLNIAQHYNGDVSKFITEKALLSLQEYRNKLSDLKDELSSIGNGNGDSLFERQIARISEAMSSVDMLRDKLRAVRTELGSGDSSETSRQIVVSGYAESVKAELASMRAMVDGVFAEYNSALERFQKNPVVEQQTQAIQEEKASLEAVAAEAKTVHENITAAFSPEQVEKFAGTLGQIRESLDGILVKVGDIKLPELSLGSSNISVDTSAFDSSINRMIEALGQLNTELANIAESISKAFNGDGVLSMQQQIDALVSAVQNAGRIFAETGGNITFVGGTHGVEQMTAALEKMGEMIQKVERQIENLENRRANRQRTTVKTQEEISLEPQKADSFERNKTKAQRDLEGQIRSTTAAIEEQKKKISDTQSSGASAAEKFGKAAGKAWHDAEKAQKAHESQTLNTLKSITSIDQQLSMVAMNMQNAFSVIGLQQFAQELIHIGGELEKHEIAMGSILGSAEKADELYQDISTLSMVSPFTVQDLTKNVKQLAAFGIEYDSLYETTKRLSDIAAGVGVDFGRISYEYSQMMAMGYLDRRHLRMFSMSGVPLLQRLQEYYSTQRGEDVSREDVDKMIFKRQIGADVVKDILWEMTNEGGKFFNMQEIMAESLASKYANLENAWNLMLGDMAKSAPGDILKEWATFATALTTHWRELGASMAAVTASMVGSKMAMAAMAVSNKAAATAVFENAKAQEILDFELSKGNVITGASTKIEEERLVSMSALTAKQKEMLLAQGALSGALASGLTIEQSLTVADFEAAIASGAVSKAKLQQAVITSNLSDAEKVQLLIKSGLTAAESAHIASLKGESAATIRLTLAGMKLNKVLAANKFMLIAAAIAAVASAMYFAYQESHKLEKSLNEIGKEQQTLTNKTIAGFDRLVRKLNDVKDSEEKRAKVVQEIQSKYGEYLDNLTLEALKYGNIADAANRARDAIKDKMKADALSKKTDAVYEVYGEKISDDRNSVKRLVEQELKRIGADTSLAEEITSEIESMVIDGNSLEQIQNAIRQQLDNYAFDVSKLSGSSRGDIGGRHTYGLRKMMFDYQQQAKQIDAIESGMGGSPYKKKIQEIESFYDRAIKATQDGNKRLELERKKNEALAKLFSTDEDFTYGYENSDGEMVTQSIKGAGKIAEMYEKYSRLSKKQLEDAGKNYKTKSEDVFGQKNIFDSYGKAVRIAYQRTVNDIPVDLTAAANELLIKSEEDVVKYYKRLAEARKNAKDELKDYQDSKQDDEDTLKTIERLKLQIELIEQYGKEMGGIDWSKWEKQSGRSSSGREKSPFEMVNKRLSALQDVRSELDKWTQLYKEGWTDKDGVDHIAKPVEEARRLAMNAIRESGILEPFGDQIQDFFDLDGFLSQIKTLYDDIQKITPGEKYQDDKAKLLEQVVKLMKLDVPYDIAKESAGVTIANIKKAIEDEGKNWDFFNTLIGSGMHPDMARAITGISGDFSTFSGLLKNKVRSIIEENGTDISIGDLLLHDDKWIENKFGPEMPIYVSKLRDTLNNEIQTLYQQLGEASKNIRTGEQQIADDEAQWLRTIQLATNATNKTGRKLFSQEVIDILNRYMGIDIGNKTFDLLKKKVGPIYDIVNDLSNLTYGRLSDTIHKIEDLFDVINGKKDYSVVSSWISEKDVDLLRNSTDAIDELSKSMIESKKAIANAFGTDGLSGIIGSYIGLFEFNKLSKKFRSEADQKRSEGLNKEADDLDKQADSAKKESYNQMSNIFTASFNAIQKMSEELQNLAEKIGDDWLKEQAEMMSSTGSFLSSVAAGAQAGGLVGALVMGASNVVEQLASSFMNARAQEYLFEKSMQDFERALTLLHTTAKSKDFESIFGTDKIKMSQKAWRNSRKAYEEYAKYIKNNTLQSIAVKTKDHSGLFNLFGIKDKYTSLKDLAPQLFDGLTGELNVDEAKEFLKTNKQLTDVQKEEIQNAIDLKEKYQENVDIIHQLLNDWYGSWSSSLTDAIFNGILNGTDAWDEFEKAGADAILALGKQMMQEQLFNAYFKSFEKDLTNAFEEEDPDRLKRNLIGISGEIMKGLPSVFDAAKVWGEDFIEMAERQGYSFEETSKSLSKSIQGMSDEQADILAAYAAGIFADTSQEVSILEQIRDGVLNMNEFFTGDTAETMTRAGARGWDEEEEAGTDLTMVEVMMSQMAYVEMPKFNVTAEAQLAQLNMIAEHTLAIRDNTATMNEYMMSMSDDIHRAATGVAPLHIQ